MPVRISAFALVLLSLSAACSQPVAPSRVDAPAAGISLVQPLEGAAATSEVPFRGRFEGSYTTVFEPPPSTFFAVNLTATGTATQLGNFTLNAPHRVNTVNGSASGTFRFTSANGDALTGTFTGQSTPTPNPTVFSIVETATIAGGTGRFGGAHGGFVIRRTVDLTNPFADGTFEGTVSTIGSLR